VTDPGVPTTANKGGFQVPSYADYKAQAMAAVAQKDPAVVPLWQARPKSFGKVYAPIGNPMDAMTFTTKPKVPSLATADEAKAAFLDMDPADMERFRKKAVAVGLLSQSDPPSALFNVWQQMVSETASYNKTKKSPTKYISPWEAVDRLAMDRAGKANAAFDGFSSSVQSQVQQVSDQQLAGTARQVLQQELGRDPTAAELRSYTIAVNQAAQANPVVTRTANDGTDPANTVSSSTTSGGIDPQQVILDQVRQDPEHAQYQASTLYYQAALNALNSIVSM